MHFTYSIIIPHRNSLELLQRAISSIPERKDIQIIIVDNTPFEIDFSSISKSRESNLIVLYSNTEKGAGHARNVGLNEALGEWLLFLDADDFYNVDAFDHFDKYVSSSFDIIYFSASSVYSDTMKEADRHKSYSKLVSDFLIGAEKAEDYLRYWHIPPWSKLIRKSLVQKEAIYFDEVPASNDLMFSVKSGHLANRIWADDFPVYCITVNKGSLTRTKNKINSRSRFLVYIRQFKFMTEIGRNDLQIKLMATVIKSFRFGLKEFYWYISTAHKEKVNIFIGINRWPKVIYSHIFRGKKKDNYTVFEN